ncbi:hypothetical protein [Ammoniphilus sp. CFH 90114]|uniref:hypothetical protein n=1 Tax=Ammoniphilus sp. CFH 90114 TaxID=2493665 RepID=UPI00100F8F4F|nr:hypothetical protein [Ammoniphilus sp. CFH 90114]RXT04911.1 hypothetical protein EIZ39_19510 [Ammoniphilus sp. CFH 90114]
MFDPTIYENLKVVVEGAVYDLDEVGVILVTDRIDRIDLSTMSRYYAIQFREKDEAAGDTVAEIRLYAGMEDLAAEILEREERFAGCRVEVSFKKRVVDLERECAHIEKLLQEVWQNRPMIKQVISFAYGQAGRSYENQITVAFGRKINEEQIEDMTMLIDHVLHSVQQLNQVHIQ